MMKQSINKWLFNGKDYIRFQIRSVIYLTSILVGKLEYLKQSVTK